MRESLRRFDRVVDGWVMRLPGWLQPVMAFFTLIGQPPFTVGIGAAVLGYGYALEKPFYLNAGLIAIATVVVISLLKLFARRKRPATEYVKHMLLKTFSFPSGHAGGALVSYGLAAIVVSARWPDIAPAAWVVAAIAIFLVSLSRVYLGAHFASDIIGGWIVGGAGLAAIVFLK